MVGTERIAIVGTGGVLPGAQSLAQFWSNIVARRDATAEVPPERWPLPPDLVYAKELGDDHAYSRRACLVDRVDLDTHGLAIDSATLARLDPMFHVLLAAGSAAWRDAVSEPVDRQRVGVILGNIALPTDTTSALAEEIFVPLFERQLGIQREDSTVPKVERLNRYVLGLPAGVLAAALGLGGGTMMIDSACASSLFAVKLAVDELLAGRADAMLTGGMSRPDCLYTQMGFSQLRALSPSGRCSPFDASADGLVVGEGACVFVLKRLSDALKHGDHIYAVIAGMGLSNDIGGNLMSPDREGQLRAIRAGYRQAGWAPHGVDLIECHGTGTPVGDKVELAGLAELWRDAPRGRRAAIGSVKSNVGHLLTGAGAAGLLKVLLALKEKTLPPSANFERPPADVDLSAMPLEILREARPWQEPSSDHPRRAAISAFGFGGVNAHLLLEEWPNNGGDARARRPLVDAGTVIRSGDRPPAVAIVGMGAHIGPWGTLSEFQHRVLGGGGSQVPAPAKHWWGHPDAAQFAGYLVDRLDVPLARFRIPPRELESMLPQQLLLLKVAAEALDDARLGEVGEPRLHTGVYVGLGLDLNTSNFHFRWSLAKHARRWADELGLELPEADLAAWIAKLREAAGPSLDANRTMGALGGIVAARVARAFRIGGPCFNVSSEETSALKALEIAMRSLQAGEVEVALVGAVDLASDIRAVIAQRELRPFSASGEPRPFGVDADGTLLGEGAAALVLKRHEDAIRDGDRIYALLRGVGSARGGDATKATASSEAYELALRRAYEETKIDPASVGLIETHGSGIPDEDAIEATAIASFFGETNRSVAGAIGSTKATVGHAGAAAAIASTIKASLCLYYEILPPLSRRKWRSPLDECDLLFAPVSPQFWLRNRVEGPRRAGVSAISVDGNCTHCVLEAVEQPLGTPARMAPLGERSEGLFVSAGDSTAALTAGLDRLEAFAKQNNDPSAAVIARRWQKQNRASSGSRLAVALLARSREELQTRLAEARHAVAAGQAMRGEHVFYSPQPLGSEGQVALVFPGVGNQFAGMGRTLGAWWPEVLRRQDRQNDRLAAQLAAGRFWTTKTPLAWSHLDVIFGQVCLGTMVADLLSDFGLAPQAAIGYSLGESAAMFATHTWRARDEMLGRMHDSSLFTSDLCGRCDAVREAWQLGDGENVDWRVGVVSCSPDAVRQAIEGRDRIYLLIVNTPNECVVGGDRHAVEQLARKLDTMLHPVIGVTTVHCQVVESVTAAYRELHQFETTPPAGLRLYSTAWAEPYDITPQRVAESILAQATGGFDFAQLVQRAYADGVRIFVETGPGGSASRMIDHILGDRPHVARSACLPGRDDVATVLRLAAQLVAERVPLELDHICQVELDEEPASAPVRTLAIARGGEPFRVPPPPAGARRKQPAQAANGRKDSPPGGTGTPILDVEPVLAQISATEAAQAEAQSAFLDVSRQVADTMDSLATFRHKLVTPSSSQPQVKDVAFAREACLEFATGSIARVLGDEFAAVDSHPTRVRLPDEPLMLVDRILTVEGRPRSMAAGRVVTEHDVGRADWYLEGGSMPTSLSIEAGQADLFLSAFLGVDFETRGLAVYRLLDAAVTFHRELPRAGETIRYDIRIERFFRQGDTHLFRFGFDATIDGRPLLSMRDGCAGFFTAEELAAGQGVVETALESRRAEGRRTPDWLELVSIQRESFDDVQLAALQTDDLAACFGPQFDSLGLTSPLTLPKGRMALIDRVLSLDPEAATGHRAPCADPLHRMVCHPPNS